MRRIAILCGLCTLLTGAAASGAPLSRSSTGWALRYASPTPLVTGRLPRNRNPVYASGARVRTHYRTSSRTHGSHAAQVVMLGEQAIQPSVGANGVGVVQAFAFRARRTGTAGSITVYIDALDRATAVFAGLYSSRDSRPHALLTSGRLQSPRASAWNTVPVGSASLRSGTIYWVAVLGKGGAIYFRDRHGDLCTGDGSAKRKSRSLPKTWPAGPDADRCQISAYVKGTPESSASGTFGGGTKVFGTNNPPGTTPTTPPPTPGPVIPSGTPPLPPVATAAPTLKGSPVVGETLTSSTGSWISSPTSYAYQWEACDTLGVMCTQITGATSNSYVLATNDTGHTIRAVVTASNAVASSAATSPYTAPVSLPQAPTNTGLPTVSGTARARGYSDDLYRVVEWEPDVLLLSVGGLQQPGRELLEHLRGDVKRVRSVVWGRRWYGPIRRHGQQCGRLRFRNLCRVECSGCVWRFWWFSTCQRGAAVFRCEYCEQHYWGLYGGMRDCGPAVKCDFWIVVAQPDLLVSVAGLRHACWCRYGRGGGERWCERHHDPADYWLLRKRDRGWGEDEHLYGQR